MNENIPAPVQSLIEQMNDPNSPFWIRNNACLTLDQIAVHIQKHVTKFQAKAVKCKAKELRK